MLGWEYDSRLVACSGTSAHCFLVGYNFMIDHLLLVRSKNTKLYGMDVIINYLFIYQYQSIPFIHACIHK